MEKLSSPRKRGSLHGIRREFSQIPSDLMSRSFPHILYSISHLLQRLQKNPDSFEEAIQ